MGFGIALFGYACLIFNEIGGGILSAILLGYGLFLASRLDMGFLKGAVSALFMLPRGIVNLLASFTSFELENYPIINGITFYLHLIAWMVTTYFWLITVVKIARNCNAPKLERQARNRLVLSVAFLSLVMGAEALKLLGVAIEYQSFLAMAEYIAQYFIIIVNTLFMHTCFILITSQKQYEKDKQQIAKERAAALEKRHKEAQTLNEKRKK